jgi:hypothetical protein
VVGTSVILTTYHPPRCASRLPAGESTRSREALDGLLEAGEGLSFPSWLLGVTAEGALDLGRLPKATGRHVVINDYAAEYAVVVGTVQSRTGRTALVQTEWIIEPDDDRPRFVTAYPA